MTHIASIIMALAFNMIVNQILFSSGYKIGTLAGFSSLIILISICVHLAKINILPESYKKASNIMYFMIETTLVVIILEISVNMVWARLIIFIESFMKYVFMDNELYLYREIGGDSLAGFIIACLALYFLYYSIAITRESKNLENILDSIIKSFQYMNRQQKDICEPLFKSGIKIDRNSSRMIKPAAH